MFSYLLLNSHDFYRSLSMPIHTCPLASMNGKYKRTMTIGQLLYYTNKTLSASVIYFPLIMSNEIVITKEIKSS